MTASILENGFFLAGIVVAFILVPTCIKFYCCLPKTTNLKGKEFENIKYQLLV
jgi:hypothetical protein